MCHLQWMRPLFPTPFLVRLVADFPALPEAWEVSFTRISMQLICHTCSEHCGNMALLLCMPDAQLCLKSEKE